MRRLLSMLLSAFCAASLSAPAGAVLLEFVPNQAQEGVSGPEFDEAALERELHGLEERLLSSQAAKALTVSELRTRALAQGLGSSDSAAQPTDRRARQGTVQGGGQGATDPLALALSQFVSGQAEGGASAAPGAAGRSPSPAFHEGRGTMLSEQDPELMARVAEMREQVADAVMWAVSPELTADGRVGFSVLGLSGFRASRGEAGTAVMFRDVNLLASERASWPQGVGPSGYRPGDMGGEDPEARNALLRLMILIWDIASHPLTIGLLILAAIVRLLLGLGARRAAI